MKFVILYLGDKVIGIAHPDIEERITPNRFSIQSELTLSRIEIFYGKVSEPAISHENLLKLLREKELSIAVLDINGYYKNPLDKFDADVLYDNYELKGWSTSYDAGTKAVFADRVIFEKLSPTH